MEKRDSPVTLAPYGVIMTELYGIARGDDVLVTSKPGKSPWRLARYSAIAECRFLCESDWEFMIPYEGYEDFIGTTDLPEEILEVNGGEVYVTFWDKNGKLL